MYSSTLVGQTDVIHILPAAPATYYIAVKDRDGGSCSFSVLIGSDVVRLADGAPQQSALARGAWTYFTFAQPSVADGATDILVSVAPEFGDPDIYVNAGTERPTTASYGWRSAGVGTDQLVISTTDTGYCADCVYTIGVQAFSASNFTIVAQSAGSTQMLQLGVPALGTASVSLAPSYFELSVDVSVSAALIPTF